MRSAKVAVIDYGMGNLLSVRRGLEHVGAEVCITSDAERILAAERVILPGVGAFPDAMAELGRRQLVEVIRCVARNNTPLLGICLGMQVLFESGEEFQETAGLGLISGRVVPLPLTGSDGSSHKIPHVGWSSLQPADVRTWDNGILAGVNPGEAAYFVHSFMAQPHSPESRIADCYYNGIPVAAVVRSDQVIGCQFHPEKSGDVGLRILRRFLSL
jgi:glutamine amidotransferase